MAPVSGSPCLEFWTVPGSTCPHAAILALGSGLHVLDGLDLSTRTHARVRLASFHPLPIFGLGLHQVEQRVDCSWTTHRSSRASVGPVSLSRLDVYLGPCPSSVADHFSISLLDLSSSQRPPLLDVSPSIQHRTTLTFILAQLCSSIIDRPFLSPSSISLLSTLILGLPHRRFRSLSESPASSIEPNIHPTHPTLGQDVICGTTGSRSGLAIKQTHPYLDSQHLSCPPTSPPNLSSPPSLSYIRTCLNPSADTVPTMFGPSERATNGPNPPHRPRQLPLEPRRRRLSSPRRRWPNGAIKCT